MRILRPHLKHYRSDIFGAVISILVSAFATLWQPRLLENIQKALLVNQQATDFRDGVYLVILGIIAIVAGVFNVYYAARIAQRVTSDLREETYAKIQSFSYEPGNERDDDCLHAIITDPNYPCWFVCFSNRDDSPLLVGTRLNDRPNVRGRCLGNEEHKCSL